MKGRGWCWYPGSTDRKTGDEAENSLQNERVKTKKTKKTSGTLSPRKTSSANHKTSQKSPGEEGGLLELTKERNKYEGLCGEP